MKAGNSAAIVAIRPRLVMPMSREGIIHRLLMSRSALVGASIVIFFLIVMAVGPAVAPYDPIEPNIGARLIPPALDHWLGTDALGRDILSRLVLGSRLSLLTAIVVGLVGVCGGVPLGIAAGYLGGRLDDLVMRIMDLLLALPAILLALGIVAALGPGLLNVMIAVGIVTVPSFARVARASTLSTREMLFVEAARAVGGNSPWIMSRHILPNIASPLVVLFSLRVATAILTAASLGFLGLGAQPPEPEWGAMLSEGRLYVRSAPHVTLIPGFVMMLAVLGFNLFGDGLRDALDPRTKRTRG